MPIISIISKRSEVVAFLQELKALFNRKDFDSGTDIILIRKRKPDDIEHSTPYTLIDLEYGIDDIAERLKELTVKEYSETRIDRDDIIPSMLFIFGKDINRKLVYIKIKIRSYEDQKKRVVCVSFHYARERMLFPYA